MRPFEWSHWEELFQGVLACISEVEIDSFQEDQSERALRSADGPIDQRRREIPHNPFFKRRRECLNRMEKTPFFFLSIA